MVRMVQNSLAAGWWAARALAAALAVVGVALTDLSAQEAAGPQKWTYKAGSEFREIDAEFVRLTETGVVLRSTANGREAELPLATLSIESHYQAVKLANPEAFSKPLVKAPEELEVAPPPFELDASEMLKSPFPDDPSIEEFLGILKRESDADNPLVFWHALPTKMQNDVEDVAVKAVGKLGRSVITQLRSLFRNLNTIVQEKKEFIKNNPYVAAQPQVVAMVEPLWPEIAGLVGAFSDEQHWQAENFEKGKIVPWVANFAAAVIPYGKQLGESVKPMLPPEAQAQMESETAFNYKILSQSANRGKVEITFNGQPPMEVEVQKVGSLWVVPAWMNPMREILDGADPGLDNLSTTVLPAVTGGLFAVNGIVGRLAAAESQADFDEAVQNLVDMVQGMIPAGGPGGPAGPGNAGSPGGRRSPRGAQSP